MNKTKAIFLDRDGVLNLDPGFLHKREDLEFYPDVIDGLIELTKMVFKLIIVTNQAGIARGIYSEDTYKKFEKEFIDELNILSNNKITIDAVYYCPHHPTEGVGKYKQNCECRKPNSGMLRTSQKDFNLDLTKSFIIGDRRSDIQAGKNVGCKTILVQTGHAGQGGTGCEIIPDYKVANFAEAVKIIKSFS